MAAHTYTSMSNVIKDGWTFPSTTVPISSGQTITFSYDYGGEKQVSDTTKELREKLKAAEKAERKAKARKKAKKKAEVEIREASHIALRALVKQAKAGDADAARYILEHFGHRA